MKDDKKKTAQLKRAEQDLIKTFREMCRFEPDLLGQMCTASSTKSPQKAPDISQSRPICSLKRLLLPPPMLQSMTEEVEIAKRIEGVEEVKEVEGVKEGGGVGVEVEVEVEVVEEVVEEVKKVQTTRRDRIVRQPRKM